MRGTGKFPCQWVCWWIQQQNRLAHQQPLKTMTFVYPYVARHTDGNSGREEAGGYVIGLQRHTRFNQRWIFECKVNRWLKCCHLADQHALLKWPAQISGRTAQLAWNLRATNFPACLNCWSLNVYNCTALLASSKELRACCYGKGAEQFEGGQERAHWLREQVIDLTVWPGKISATDDYKITPKHHCVR